MSSLSLLISGYDGCWKADSTFLGCFCDSLTWHCQWDFLRLVSFTQARPSPPSLLWLHPQDAGLQWPTTQERYPHHFHWSFWTGFLLRWPMLRSLLWNCEMAYKKHTLIPALTKLGEQDLPLWSTVSASPRCLQIKLLAFRFPKRSSQDRYQS